MGDWTNKYRRPLYSKLRQSGLAYSKLVPDPKPSLSKRKSCDPTPESLILIKHGVNVACPVTQKAFAKWFS